jgi:hypothetical protein
MGMDSASLARKPLTTIADFIFSPGAVTDDCTSIASSSWGMLAPIMLYRSLSKKKVDQGVQAVKNGMCDEEKVAGRNLNN